MIGIKNKFVVLLISFLIFSCKKEKFENEELLLVKRWKLNYSYNSIGGGVSIDPTHPSYIELEFLARGCFIIYNNEGEIKEKGRVKSISMSNKYEYSPGYYQYSFKVELIQTDLKSKDKFNFETVKTIQYYENYLPPNGFNTLKTINEGFENWYY